MRLGHWQPVLQGLHHGRLGLLVARALQEGVVGFRH